MVFGMKTFAEKQLEQKGRDYDAIQSERNRAQTACAQMGARIVVLEKLLRDLLEAHRTGNLEMNSPEIGGHDDIPLHPWHEQWLHLAEQAVNK